MLKSVWLGVEEPHKAEGMISSKQSENFFSITSIYIWGEKFNGLHMRLLLVLFPQENNRHSI